MRDLDEAFVRLRAHPWSGPAPYRSLHARGRLWQTWRDRGARPVMLGSTREGRPLCGFRLGRPTSSHVSVVLAGTHALEWVGIEVLEAVVEDLLTQAPDREVLVVPILNVDGVAHVDDDVRTGQRTLRRANGSGVDLNRNWPTHHAPQTSLLTRFLPGVGHPGPSAASEPEVQGVLRLLDAVVEEGRTVDRALSLHSVGRMILVPWGGRLRRPDARLFAAAKKVQAAIPYRYTVRQVSWWVPGHTVPGMEIDHFLARYGATALIVECSLGGLRPLEPGTWVNPFHWYNPTDPAREIEALAPALATFLRGG